MGCRDGDRSSLDRFHYLVVTVYGRDGTFLLAGRISAVYLSSENQWSGLRIGGTNSTSLVFFKSNSTSLVS